MANNLKILSVKYFHHKEEVQKNVSEEEKGGKLTLIGH
jgi:hypothetical protein